MKYILPSSLLFGLLLITLNWPLSGATGRRLCLAHGVVSSGFMTVQSLDNIRDCNIIHGSIMISSIHFPSDFAPLRNLTEFAGEISIMSNSGLQSVGQLFPNLAVIRNIHSTKLFGAMYLSQNTDFHQINLTKLSYIEGSIDITADFMCYLFTVNWEDIASDRTVYGQIMKKIKGLRNRDSCWGEMCPDVENCPRWSSEDLVQYCWSSTQCQFPCEHKAKGIYCREDDATQACHETCLGSCNGPTAFDCAACKHLMVVHTGECLPQPDELFPDQKLCPDDYLQLLDLYCVSHLFCKQEGYKIHKGKCLSQCPDQTNNDISNPSLCKPCSDDDCVRTFPGSLGVMFDADFPQKSYTDIAGYLILNLEGMSARTIQEHMPKFKSLRNITSYLKIYRSEQIRDLDVFESLQTIGMDGCELAKGFCLTIHSNEFLKRLWIPKKAGGLKILNGNVSIAHNPRLCQSEIDRFIKALKLVAPNAHVSQEGNGDRGYCGSMPIKPLLVYDQFVEKDPRNKDTDRSMWQIVPMVAFNLSNYDQILTLRVYHLMISDLHYNLSYYDPAFCDDNNKWKSHVVQVSNYSNPMYWRVVDGKQLFITNVSTPHSLNAYQYYAIYAMVQYLDGKIAISKILKFRTISAEPEWSSYNVYSEGKFSNAITLSWDLPRFPNGNITHYIVTYAVDIDARMPTNGTCSGDSINKFRVTTTPPMMTTQNYPEEIDTYDSDSNSVEARKSVINRYMAALLTKSPKPMDKEEKERILNLSNVSIPYEAHRARRAVIEAPEFSNGSSQTKMVELVTGTERMPGGDVSDYCQELQNNLTESALLKPVLEKDSKEFSNPLIVCGQKLRVTGLKHFTYYKFELRACLSPQIVNNKIKYLCSTPVPISGQKWRTQPLAEADQITVDMIHPMPQTETRKGRVYRRVVVEAPNVTNGPILEFAAKFRAAGTDHWATYCKAYKPGPDGPMEVEFLLPMSEPKYEFQVKIITGAAGTKFSPIIKFDGFVAPVPLTLILAVSLSMAFLLISAGVMLWYALVLRRKKRMMKNTTTPDWLSMNPDYQLLTPADIPSELEIERDDIEVLAELGHGAFGVVYRGIFSIPDKKIRRQVAIKSLRCDANHRQKNDFLQEALLLAGLECHHVVKMIGVVSKTQPIYVVMELMENGDLKAFLMKLRSDTFSNGGLSVGGIPMVPSIGNGSSFRLASITQLTYNDFAQMAGEVADGMAYLASQNIVHRDLAARNCLVARDKTVKIADFGLARDVYDDGGYYILKGRGPLPIRWMAPESIQDGTYKTSSDVWSYGVLLWEVVTYGEQPYQGKSNEEVFESVRERRQVLNKPKNCPDKFYNLMLRCWQFKPNERPSFIDIVRELLPNLRPDFLKVSYYGTLSPADQLGTSSNNTDDTLKSRSTKGDDDDMIHESSDSNSLPETEGLLANEKKAKLTHIEENQDKAIANLYNILQHPVVDSHKASAV